jgi:stress response protein YsnF
VFYTDFRKSLGLPEDGNYERGSIDLDAPLFGKEKSTTIPERVSPEPSLDVPLPLDEAAPGQPPAQPPKKTTDTDQFINESKQKFEKLYAQAIDRFDPLIQLGRKAKKETAVENSLAGYYGTGSTANYHVDFELAPILKEQDREALTKVAIALRDAELEGRGIQGSNRGVQVDQLRQELGDEKFQAVQGTLQKLYSYQDKMVRQYLVDTGIMSEQAYNAMRSKNQFYVPFKRVMDTVDDALGIPQAKGAASVSSQDVVKGIKGSKREIQDPLQSIIESTYKMVGLGKRQQVAKTIVGLKDQLPEGIIKPIKGTVGNKPTISLFENGKVQKYEVPPEVATAAKGMDEEGIATVFKILSQPTEIFRATATAYNPEFVIPNVVRDLQSAFVNVGLNPLKFVSGLAHLIKQDDVYQEFLKAGGQTSRVSIDRPVLEKKVGDIYSPAGIEVKNVFNFKKILQKMGEFSEQPTRIAAFEDAVKKELAQGATPEEARQRAAYMAQEATTNFARRGSKTKTVNALYAFLNARVQGIDRLARTIKKDPAGASFRMGLVSIAPAMAAYAWNRQFPSYNDERVVSARDKADNFILMLSDEPIEELKGAQFIKIPKGQVGKLANPLEEFMSFAEGKGGDVQEALLGVLSSFSPVDNIGDAIPTALRPPLENAANFNFFADQNIVPDYKKDYPPAYQYSSYTAPVYRMLGEETGKSPAKIQNLVEGYGTGIAKITEMATRPLIPEKYKSEKSKQGQDVNRTPILRRFLGGEKKTEEEAQAQQDKQQYGNIFKIRDIQSAMKRGDIPVEVGVAEIEKMQGQEPQQAKKMMFQGFGGGSQALPLEQERPKNAQEEKIADSIAKVKLQNSDKKFLKENGKYYVLNDEGNVNVIDLRETIAEPQLTGNSRLDKKIMAKFKGEITRRENDITKLYEAGLLSEEEAEQMLEELNGVRGGAGTGRKRKAKFGKLPDFSKTYKRMSKSRSLTRTVAQSKKKAQPPGAKSSIEDILTKKRKTSTIKSLLK